MYFNYCYLYAQDNGLPIDLRNPVADIHYDTFLRAIKRLASGDGNVAEFLRVGKDGFTYAEPSIGREWEHPNQQWEMDATKQDIMVKVPVVLTDKKKMECTMFTNFDFEKALSE